MSEHAPRHALPTKAPRSFTRRRFLQISGTGIGIWVVESQLGRSREDPVAALVAATPSHTASVHRRADMLDLQFAFYNLKVVSSSNGPVLQRVAPDASGALTFISVGFGPQWVDEAAWREEACVSTPTAPPLPALLAAAVSTPEFGTGSRVVFKIPSAVTSIPYTVEALLNWPQWSLSVPAPAAPAMPGVTETAIEAPWRLVLAPDATATWGHAIEPVTRNARTEVWHTRLALPRSDTDHRAQENGFGAKPAVRAVWTPDLDVQLADEAPFAGNFSQTIEPAQRKAIVRLSSDATRSPAPIPVTAKLLVLSPLGATLDLEGSWPENYYSDSAVVSWKHRGTQGRDNYVRVVTAGYLLPFGHRAVLIDESERRIDVVNGAPVAYLHKRSYIVVMEPVKTYAASGQTVLGEPNDGRGFPFATVELTTLVTPPLHLPPEAPDTRALFWPRIDTSVACDGSGLHDFQWSVIVTDREGQRSQVAMPLEFMDTTTTESAGVTSYNSQPATGPRRLTDFGGQKVCIAPPAKPGSTTMPTHALSFGAVVASSAVALNEAKFFPLMTQADVHLDAVQTMTGKTAQPVTIVHEPDYLAQGLTGPSAPKGGVFAALKDALPLDFGSSADSGGIASPALSIAGLSRDTGPVGPFNEIKNGTFDPEKFLAGAAPKIFGDVDLLDLLGDVPDVSPPTGNLPDVRVPGLVSELVYDNGRQRPPTASKTTFKWTPKLKSNDIFDPHYKPPQGDTVAATLDLTMLLVAPIGPGQRTSSITGDLRNFTIALPDTADAFIALGFERLGFTAVDGAKPSVDVKLGSVAFKGDLEFVNKLEELLKFPGSGLSIDVQPSGVSAGITIALPNVSIGVFSLQNLSFSAGLVIPFDGKPVLAHFAFCTRENPFLVSVGIFGGGGFFALYLDPSGVQILEISVEFGGNVAFDIVVASGGVHVLAGVYFKLDTTGAVDKVTLTGFVKIGGSLSVLGLVTLSLEFDMSLSYVDDGGRKLAVGEATLEVSIDVLFVSIPVSMHVRKEFGGGGDPTFGQMLTSADWTSYCNAFAA